MLGRLPANAAKMNKTQSGAFQCTLADRPISAMTQTPAARGSTLPCPWRSTRREMRGASNAVAKAKVAATAPARVYAPRTCDSMVMMPMPIIGKGRRAMAPASTKPAAPGAWNNSRYGFGTGVLWMRVDSEIVFTYIAYVNLPTQCMSWRAKCRDPAPR